MTSDRGVRGALPADADDVGRLQAALWADAFAADLPEAVLAQCTPAAFSAAWRTSLSDPPSPGHVLWLAHEGSTVVGLSAVGPSDDPDLHNAAEILVMGVDVDHRERGHGSRLLAASVEQARTLSAALLVAWVPFSQETVRAFLQGAGFAPDGARRTRVVDPQGRTLGEARMVAQLSSTDTTP
ncbi:Mycothiol acetyltransferase [Austwickia sp. TVS 96-490-7B]|uniref:GNAT family N-acetyltransferase n=1 Tax=Austwickia sp. TVS 96-490-7B TaxID=2830843 RepID=UPI001C597BD5|nr:GNAT family N-acetyltransferase [Austwickia sp. TVS 96-490-7B]MBW3086491.1 Mycothiol acetyltransferase [Austwickia sp. TVS 96-490-7B]